MATSLDHAINSFSNHEFDGLLKSMKDGEFIKHIKNFADEIKDPKKVRQFQEEVKLYEKQRGVGVKFVIPSAGLALQCEARGLLAFINVGVSDQIEKPSFSPEEKDSEAGIEWRLPHVMLPLRQEFGLETVKETMGQVLTKKRCKVLFKKIEKEGLWVYDVVVHPICIKVASENESLKKNLINIIQESIKNKLKEEVVNLKFLTFGYYIGTPRIFQIKNIIDQKLYNESQNDSLIYPNVNNKPDDILKKELKTKDEPLTPVYKLKYVSHSSLQDHSIVNDEGLSICKPHSIKLSIELPEVPQASFIEAKVSGQDFFLETLNEVKYLLKIKLPYLVKEDPIESKFTISTNILDLTFAILNDADKLKVEESESSCVMNSNDSGIECENGYRTNSDGDNSSISSQEEFFECKSKISDDNRTKDIDISCIIINKYILPSCKFSQNDIYIFMKIQGCNLTNSTIKFNKIDSHSFSFEFTSLGQSFTPIVYGGYILIKQFAFEDLTSSVEGDETIIKIKKDGNWSLKSIGMGLEESSLLQHLVEEDKINQNEKLTNDDQTDESDVPSESVKSSEEETRIPLKKSMSLDIPARKRRTSDCFVTGSYPRGILKGRGRSRCFSDSQVECTLSSSLEIDLEDDAIEEEGEEESQSEFGSVGKKSVHFNDYVAKKVFKSTHLSLGQIRRERKKAAIKRERKLSAGSSNSEGSDCKSTTEDEATDKDTNAHQFKKSSKTQKSKKGNGNMKSRNGGKKSKKNKQGGPCLSNNMIFQLDDS